MRRLKKGNCSRVWLVIVVVTVLVAGCRDSSDQPTNDRESLWIPGQGYVSLIPSLPSMGRILDQELHDAEVDGIMDGSVCFQIEDFIVGTDATYDFMAMVRD